MKPSDSNVLTYITVFYNMAWSGLLVGYAAEILPYSLRAKGLTVMFLMVDVALFFNQYVNPIALDAIAWKYCKYSTSMSS